MEKGNIFKIVIISFITVLILNIIYIILLSVNMRILEINSSQKTQDILIRFDEISEELAIFNLKNEYPEAFKYFKNKIDKLYREAIIYLDIEVFFKDEMNYINFEELNAFIENYSFIGFKYAKQLMDNIEKDKYKLAKQRSLLILINVIVLISLFLIVILNKLIVKYKT